jgi:peroxiredoxin
MLNTESFPIEFYAVYAGDVRTSWDTYIKEKLVVDSPDVKVTHLWDPTLESDFQRKYGVIQTPRLFLIAPDGTILGRGLDTKGLYAMLHGIFDQVELTYGSKESEELFDNVFALEERPSKDDVMYITEYINANTLERGDTVMFRQLTGDLMYYLASKTGEGYKEGLSDLLENQIFSRGDVWKSQDDSLKVTGYAEILSDLLSKAVPGTVVPDLKLPGVLMTSKKSKEGTFRLKKLRGSENVVIFYTVGCPVCDAEKAAARGLVQKDLKAKVLMVNVDSIVENDPVLADQLFKSFDLTSLPFILQTDKKGRILRRYISLQ